MTLKRLANSTVVWSWITNILRALSGVLILPLLFRKLSKSDLGMSGVLLSFSTLGVIFDFGFAPTIDRFISYAMGGAKSLEAHGVPAQTDEQVPNYPLLWDLLLTTQRLYRYLTLILLIILGIGGTLTIENLIRREHALHPEFSLFMPRLAWSVTLVSIVLDIYSNWWGIYLRGLNQVRAAAQVTAVATFVKLIISGGALLCGAGLLSLPLATIVASGIQRWYARHRVLQLLPPAHKREFDAKKLFLAMWPTSWRMGLQLASSYLIVQVNTILCARLYHLEITGGYAYSVQLMNYAVMMASVWISTKWPVIGQYQARRDYEMIQKTLRPRLWLQILTFVLLAGGVIFVAPGFLHWVGKGKDLLPIRWLILLAFGAFMDLQISTFGTLISTGNRIPFLWPGIVTNMFSMTLSLALLHWSALGVGSFILGPIISGAIFNYWYWPPFAARGIRTTLYHLFFGSVQQHA